MRSKPRPNVPKPNEPSRRTISELVTLGKGAELTRELNSHHNHLPEDNYGLEFDDERDQEEEAVLLVKRVNEIEDRLSMSFILLCSTWILMVIMLLFVKESL